MSVTITTQPCPRCGASSMPGVRWCAICHGNIINPSVGKLAEPSKRLGAFFIDFFIPLALFLFVIVPGVVGLIGAIGGHGSTPATGGLLTLILIAAFVGFVAWCIKLFAQGQTPGKLALGLRVVKEDGSSPGLFSMIVREWIGKWISGFIFSLGYIWILIDKDRQAWHDKFVSTYVVDSH